MLTPGQTKLYEILVRHFVEHGRSPSFRELQKYLRLASPSGIQARIDALINAGFVRNLRGKARSHVPTNIPTYKELLELATTHPNLTQNEELAGKVSNVAGILGMSIATNPDVPEIRAT